MSETSQKKPDYKLIIILLSGAFISFLSNTFLNVALPAIKNDFGISTSAVQWVSTSYMLVSGIIIPTTAYLMQKFSARTLFLTAMSLFLLGTIVAGFSPAFIVLILGRMIQASGSAMLMPLLMNIMISSFPPDKRGTAMGLFSLVMFFAPAIGPTVSGIVVENYSWHVLFYMMIPVLIIVLVVGFWQLPEIQQKREAHIDIMSIILSTIGFGGVLYGLSSAGENGLASSSVLIPLLLGIAGITLYVIRQFKLEFPMLDFRVYKYPMYTIASLIIGAANMALFAGMILIPIFMQDIQGLSPLDTGLLMLPGALIMGFMSPVSGKLFDMYGPKTMAITGLALAVVTTFFLSRLEIDTSFTYLLTIYMIRALGMTMVNTPVMTNGMNSLPAHLTPHGSSLNSMLNQVSGSIGIALLITVMQTYTNITVNKMDSPTEAMINQATLEGINLAFLVGTGFLFLALVAAFFLKQSSSADTIGKSIARARPINEDKKKISRD
ncbi:MULTISPECIES: MDR family MFS transporter [Jeotgalicoccus]|uniref:Quinolone resistance protein NorB n=1 Tax=Jeotgalicoccus nanhaiensis TaxID=568603 RepID=A0ABR9XZB6_9STAP|nr:MDR family MFS transporter [Jeotgalicoccus nanhaiensis]MBF0754330.1 multidrug efflux MFS transporter [Jeotgalicoccus nanhaiensis]TFU61257.1 DHA2 family efflux MFS transporter permease subunit [Jeotgalicoccus nanhaiensis]